LIISGSLARRTEKLKWDNGREKLLFFSWKQYKLRFYRGFTFLIIIKSVPIYRDPEGDRLLIEGAFTMFLLAGLK